MAYQRNSEISEKPGGDDSTTGRDRMTTEKSDDFVTPRAIREADGDMDVAARYANHFTDSEMYSRREETRLRWKLDLRLVPLLWFNVTLGAMDKVTTSTAALYNLREDTGLDGNKYSWVGSAFYVGIAPVLSGPVPGREERLSPKMLMWRFSVRIPDLVSAERLHAPEVSSGQGDVRGPTPLGLHPHRNGLRQQLRRLDGLASAFGSVRGPHHARKYAHSR